MIIDIVVKILKYLGKHPIWLIFMFFVIGVDLTQLIVSPILDLVLIGEIMDWIIDLGMNGLYAAASFINRKKLSNAKNMLKIFLAATAIAVGKAIPFISAFPLWTIDFGIMIFLLAAETARQDAAKIASAEDTKTAVIAQLQSE